MSALVTFASGVASYGMAYLIVDHYRGFWWGCFAYIIGVIAGMVGIVAYFLMLGMAVWYGSPAVDYPFRHIGGGVAASFTAPLLGILIAKSRRRK